MRQEVKQSNLPDFCLTEPESRCSFSEGHIPKLPQLVAGGRLKRFGTLHTKQLARHSAQPSSCSKLFIIFTFIYFSKNMETHQ